MTEHLDLQQNLVLSRGRGCGHSVSDFEVSEDAALWKQSIMVEDFRLLWSNKLQVTKNKYLVHASIEHYVLM